MRKLRTAQGFTLIETAIAITLVGLALGTYLQYTIAQREKARYEITQKRLVQIRTALTAFAAQKGRLPCPQSPVEASSEAFRRSRFSPSNKNEKDACGPEAPAPDGVIVFVAEARSAEEASEVWTGVLPARDLRLNDEQAYDGWGRLFTYAASRSLTLPGGLRKNPVPPGVISVEDESGNNILDTPNSGRYVVVSHGSSGAGGWTADGGQKPCEKKTMDGKNCDGDAGFVVAPFSQKKGRPFFDDFIIHDDLDASGTLLDKLLRCNAGKKFYLPSEEGADNNGCKGFENVFEGACLHSMTLQPSGEFLPNSPVVMMPPATVEKEECACEKGYRMIEVGAWDDSDPVVVINTETEGEDGSQEGGEVKEYIRKSLHTCVR